MSRPRRLKKKCKYQGKPSWRDVDSAIWGARRFYQNAEERGYYDVVYPQFYYKCPAPHGDQYSHYHLTSKPYPDSFVIYTEEDEKKVDSGEMEPYWMW